MSVDSMERQRRYRQEQSRCHAGDEQRGRELTIHSNGTDDILTQVLLLLG